MNKGLMVLAMITTMTGMTAIGAWVNGHDGMVSAGIIGLVACIVMRSAR